MPIDPAAVHRHLARLLQARSLDAALDADVDLLDEMARLVEPIGPAQDDKLQQLVTMLTTGTVGGQPLLVTWRGARC